MMPLVSIEGAMELLAVERKTVLRLLNDGELTGLKVGRPWRIVPESIVAFVERNGTLRVDPQERLITMESAALMLGVTADSMRQLARKAKIPSCKIGVLWRTSERAVFDFVARGVVITRDPATGEIDGVHDAVDDHGNLTAHGFAALVQGEVKGKTGRKRKDAA